MTSLRQAISDVVEDLRAFNLDDRFSYRFIASKLKKRIETFVKQDSMDRTIFNVNEIWKPLTCVQFDDADYANCSCYYDGCSLLKVSTQKIPEVYTGKYGNFIKMLNVKNSMEYKQIKSYEYKDIINREFVNKRLKYFWIEDSYLYVPDADVEETRIVGLFKDSQEADLFNGDITACYKPLDSILLVPDYIIDIAKKDTAMELAKINRAIVEDDNPDLETQTK